MNKKLTALLAGTAGFGLAVLLGQGTAPETKDASIERIKKLVDGPPDARFEMYQDRLKSLEERAHEAATQREVMLCAAPKDGFVVAITPSGTSVVIDSMGNCRQLTRIPNVEGGNSPTSVNLRLLPDIDLWDHFAQASDKEMKRMLDGASSRPATVPEKPK